MASLRRASASSRSSLRLSSISASSRSGRSLRRRAQERGEIGEGVGIGGEALARLVARLRLDAAHAGRDRAFADDRDEADVAGAADMGAAAQLDRIGALVVAVLDRAHGDDAHLVAVFLAEQRARA